MKEEEGRLEIAPRPSSSKLELPDVAVSVFGLDGLVKGLERRKSLTLEKLALFNH